MSTSFHYKNLALDIRTNDLPTERVTEYHQAIKEALGSEYDVVLEKDHVHIECSASSPYAKWDKNV